MGDNRRSAGVSRTPEDHHQRAVDASLRVVEDDGVMRGDDISCGVGVRDEAASACFEKLDRVPVRILGENLRTARTAQEFASEGHAFNA